jgi:hypothetical protein
MNIYEQLVYLATNPYDTLDKLKSSDAVLDELRKEFSSINSSQYTIDIRRACETMVSQTKLG